MSIEDYGRGIHMMAHEGSSAQDVHYNDEAPTSLIRARAIAGTLIGTSERSSELMAAMQKLASDMGIVMRSGAQRSSWASLHAALAIPQAVKHGDTRSCHRHR